MKDLNFFDSYVVKKKIKVEKNTIYYIVLLFTICLMGTFYVFNEKKISKLSQDIESIRNVVEDSRVISKVDEINAKKSKLDFLKENIEKIKLQYGYIEENEKIDNALLEMLSSSIPEGLFLTSLSIYSDEINLVGKAKNELLIAQLSDNLKSYEPFKEVFVSTIYKENQYYSFNLDISLKEVELNGENSTDEKD